MRGEYRFWLPGMSLSENPVVRPNNLVDEGEESFMKMLVRDDQSDVAAGANFYVGLCGSTFAETDTLATLGGEPTVTNGYARGAIARNSTGWPTIEQVSGKYRAVSLQVTFTASGGNFSAAIDRAFLCNVASGTGGKLFSISSALASSLTIAVGSPFTIQYILYLD